jgi:NAD(P)H-dependent flavin oxidoreductase YrpB (nitropropane dioxygenase family)
MRFVGLAELASAVSDAGGRGRRIPTALMQRSPELLAKEIAKWLGMTDRPFRLN